jgi:hypothetical protein
VEKQEANLPYPAPERQAENSGVFVVDSPRPFLIALNAFDLISGV